MLTCMETTSGCAAGVGARAEYGRFIGSRTTARASEVPSKHVLFYFIHLTRRVHLCVLEPSLSPTVVVVDLA